jgi:circadian clock protein KaiC
MTATTANTVEKISTGIAGLDDILDGGLPRDHMYLVQGESGTGKTTLGLQFVLAGVEAGEEVLFISLSETAQDLHQIAAAHGWSLEKVHIYEPLDDSDIKQLTEEQTVW